MRLVIPESTEALSGHNRTREEGYSYNLSPWNLRAHFPCVCTHSLQISYAQGTKPKDVKCEIHPNRMQLSIEGVGVITEGEFEGKLALDGCYWFMTDMSLDPIPINLDDPSNLEDVREGPVQRGETCVQVFLEKMKPYDTLWRNVFIQEGDDRILLGDGREENHGMPVEDDELDNNLNGR